MSQSVSEWVSDNVTYWAVRLSSGQLKMKQSVHGLKFPKWIHIPSHLVEWGRLGSLPSPHCTMGKLWKRGLNFTNKFSTKIQWKLPNILMMMYKHQNIRQSNPFSKFLTGKVVKIVKNLLGVLSQDKVLVKKLPQTIWVVLHDAFFVTRTPNWFKVWNNHFCCCYIFSIFTKGTQEKIFELESESDMLMQKLKNCLFHLPITTFS